ncbi:EI24 domain-containing protein [Seohaeicola saemankumensis]|uniref:EI24 domain-containing protein n=1 Tax=Seohaeicola saemankumensis TaxID=481181 RepID=A0ABW3TGS9_9RHOB
MSAALVLTSFLKALGQLGDRRLSRVLWLGIGLALLLLALAAAGVQALLLWWAGDGVTLPLVGEVQWIATLAGWSGPVAMLLLSVVLMVPVASAISGLFLDRVADAVEARHYPQAGQARAVPLLEALRDSLGFLGVMILANLVALILYLVFSPVALFIFWGLNGFLLGREYFTLVAIRHLGRSEAARMRKQHAGVVWLAGVLMAMPLSIPLVNLAIPVLGAATFTHLFHGLRARVGPGSATG